MLDTMILTEYLPKIRRYDKAHMKNLVEFFFRLQETARREGLLAIEEHITATEWNPKKLPGHIIDLEKENARRKGWESSEHAEGETFPAEPPVFPPREDAFFTALLSAVMNAVEDKEIAEMAENLIKTSRPNRAELAYFVVGANCILLLQHGDGLSNFARKISSLLGIPFGSECETHLRQLKQKWEEKQAGVKSFIPLVDEIVKKRLLEVDAAIRRRVKAFKKEVADIAAQVMVTAEKQVIPLQFVAGSLNFSVEIEVDGEMLEVGNDFGSVKVWAHSPSKVSDDLDESARPYKIECADSEELSVCYELYKLWAYPQDSYMHGCGGNPALFMKAFECDDLDAFLQQKTQMMITETHRCLFAEEGEETEE